MKSKQVLETCSLESPITIDFFDLGTVEQVVEEAFVKEPKKRRKSLSFQTKKLNLAFYFCRENKFRVQ